MRLILSLVQASRRLIVPIVAKTRQAILDKADEVTQLPVDLIERRADFYEDHFKIPALLETLNKLCGCHGMVMF